MKTTVTVREFEYDESGNVSKETRTVTEYDPLPHAVSIPQFQVNPSYGIGGCAACAQSGVCMCVNGPNRITVT